LIIAPENLERFRQLILADRGLDEQLQQTAGLAGFVALPVRLAALVLSWLRDAVIILVCG
jgi:hypothetical protein